MHEKLKKLTTEERKTICMVEEISKFFSAEWLGVKNFEGWPGLPSKRGGPPSLKNANYFFLGCCVDWREKTYKAWSKAKRFCEEEVPRRHNGVMWKWIANHSEDQWNKKYRKYDLHWLRAGHRRVHKIARAIQGKFGGDPRKIWEPGRERPLLETLQNDLGVGPAISRMLIGALRDHGLIKLRKSDFKPDIWVRRLMKALDLCKTDEWRDCLKAAKECFSDPWVADRCFYHLGADYGIKTKRQFQDYFSKMQRWIRSRSRASKKVQKFRNDFLADIGNKDWNFYNDSSRHWIGLDLVKTKGSLARPMDADNPCNLWVWLGIGFDGDTVSAIEIGGDERYFASKKIRSKLTEFKLKEQNHDPSITKGQRKYWGYQVLADPSDLKYALTEKTNIAKELLSILETV
jgi:hypothetical protein